MRNDYLDYLAHSAKGSSWQKHKYVKKVGGKYYYEEVDSRESSKAQETLKQIESERKEIKKYEDDANLVYNMWLDEKTICEKKLAGYGNANNANTQYLKERIQEAEETMAACEEILEACRKANANLDKIEKETKSSLKEKPKTAAIPR